MADNTNTSSDSDLFKIHTKVKSREHQIYLSITIEHEAEQYIELLTKFYEANSNDIIVINLFNFGGSLHTGVLLGNAIKQCEAHVICNVMAPCFSMGAILALAGDDLVMADNTYLMFHNYSTIVDGKAGELKASMKETEEHFAEVLKNFCTPFLTPVEIKDIVNDKDVYVRYNDKGLKDRLKRHFKRKQ